MLEGFFAEAKTVEFVQLRVKLFCPKIDPLFWDFCLWGGGEGLGVKKMRFDLLFQEKKSLPRYLYGYSVQNLPGKIC